MRTFTFKGKSSAEYGVIVESIQRLLIAGRRDTRITVPLRDGEVDSGAYMAYESNRVEVSCGFLGADKADRQRMTRKIAQWLSGEGRLIFSDEPDKYYKAVRIGEIDLDAMMRVGRFTVEFDCFPFAYGRTVDEPFTGQYVPNYLGTAPTPTLITIYNAGTEATGIQIQARKRVN